MRRALLLVLLLPAALPAQQIGPGTAVHGNRAGQMARPIRYRPEGDAFVIDNGTERFNRPLYGGNTAFRVDGGDRPEFVLYLPGKGGNLRFAVRGGAGAWWLHEAASITTRYVPGELRYAIRDPRLGEGTIRLSVIATYDGEGVVVRATGERVPRGLSLGWAFGGVSGKRGKRDGDIGTEAVPISDYFQPRAADAEGNRLTLADNGFTVEAKAATLAGTTLNGRIDGRAPATAWDDPATLFAGDGDGPLATGSLDLGRRPAFLSIAVARHAAGTQADLADYRAVSRDPAAVPPPAPTLAVPPRRLLALWTAAAAEAQRRRTQIAIDTPDPYLNAAAGALAIAADATWDAPQQAIMHGAIAWRTKLLGWRGPYALDALGWHDRASANIAYWMARQNTTPVPATLPPPDAASNLSRSEAALHSNGDLSNSHYDMNSVFFDAFFRHLDWTGDVAEARRFWPQIVRHLDWQRRLFRRPFGPEGLPLYESYAQIWASDDIHYGGGGTAYGSAYNVFANRRAAKLARLLGHDPAPFEAEADAIEAAMRRHLWLPQQGRFAEYRDSLGLQLVHPSAGLWSYYHTIDSGVPRGTEGWQMTGAMLRDLPRLPVEGPGVPPGLGLLSTTDWMPYSWSVNNVVMGENAHAALALWQVGRPGAAYTLAKSAIVASMFMGITPGNVGTLTYLDVFRRESQRDFADGAGTLSRALVEGLFGLRPDALAQTLTIAPGFPGDWTHAAIRHPDVTLAFTRDGDVERWRVTQPGDRFARLRLRLPMRREGLASVRIGGRAATWRPDSDGAVVVEAEGIGRSAEVELRWTGNPVASRETPAAAVPVATAAVPLVASGRNDPVNLSRATNDAVVALFAKGKYLRPRSPGVSLALPSQGAGAWAGHVDELPRLDDTGLRRVAAASGGVLTLPDGGAFRLAPAAPIRAAFVSRWSNYPAQATVPLSGRAQAIRLLMAGTTNSMQSRIANGEVVVRYADGGEARLPLVNPDSWWPIERDYLIDDYQFRARPGDLLRVDLATGLVRKPDGTSDRAIPGGAATVLSLPLDPDRPLASLTVRALAQDVVIGTLAATLVRPKEQPAR